jgi:hypothetical protein
MKRVLYASVASAAITLAAPATYAAAEDVGCCRVECSGPNTVRVTLNETIASECEVGSQECSATWSAESCPAMGQGPGVPGGGSFEIHREDAPPAQR